VRPIGGPAGVGDDGGPSSWFGACWRIFGKGGM